MLAHTHLAARSGGEVDPPVSHRSASLGTAGRGTDASCDTAGRAPRLQLRFEIVEECILVLFWARRPHQPPRQPS